MAKRIPTPADIFRFYVDGFRSMTLGRTLWAIILLKLFIMFAILRLFFFPDQLAGMSQEQRSEHVLEQLTRRFRQVRPPQAPPGQRKRRLKLN